MTVFISKGKDKPPEPIAPRIGCSACGATNTPLIVLVIDSIQVEICIPKYLVECSLRYRMGMSPASYQQYLKAQEVMQTVR